MQSIHGFVTLADFVDNTTSTVAEFFELSPFAMTYSRHRGEYQHADRPGYTLHTFSAVDTDTTMPYVLPATQVREIFEVTLAVQNYLVGRSFPYDLLDLINTVQAQFADQLSGFAIGDLHVGETTTLPEWLSWTSIAHPDTAVKVWLRNLAFESQYPLYEIVTVPPLDLLDRFFGTYGDLATTLSAITVQETINRIQDFRGENPETYIRVYEFDFVNKNNTTQSTSVLWGVVVYGKAGDNIDAIKDTIANYVLANSTHTQTEWEVIFPSIFKRNEFLFYPRWDKVAIPNLTSLAAIYSSAMNPAECIDYAKSVWSSITASFVENNLTLLPFDYKGITLIALNGVSNDAEKAQLMTLFPDYIPVNTSSLDFNRMALTTREWLLAMVEMLVIAETATEYTAISDPNRRVMRNGVLYIARMIANVNYMVAARSNLDL